MMGGNLKGRLQFAVSEHLEAITKPPDHAALHQQFRCHFFFGIKFREVTKVDDSVMFLEDICKPALGQAALQGHLATFKPRTHARARARPLPLAAASAVFPCPEPMPWPILLRRLCAPAGGCSVPICMAMSAISYLSWASKSF